jgi:hypothetical protein
VRIAAVASIADTRPKETVMMDREAALLRARIDALESVVVFLAQHDDSVAKAVRTMLTAERQRAMKDANEPETAHFQNSVEWAPRSPQDKLAEAVRVEAHDLLLGKLGAGS